MRKANLALVVLLATACGRGAPTAGPTDAASGSGAITTVCEANLRALDSYLAYPDELTNAEAASRMLTEQDAVGAAADKLSGSDQERARLAQSTLANLRVQIAEGADRSATKDEYGAWVNVSATADWNQWCKDAGALSFVK